MRILFLCILFGIYSYAFEAIKINNTNVDLNTIGYTYFIKESSNLKTPKDILNNEKLKLSTNNYLGIKNGPYWTQFTITNKTKNSLDLIISSEHSGVNYLDIYVFNNSNIEKEYFLGDMRAQKNREIVHHNSIFDLKINSNETKTIIAKFDNPGMYKINWSIKDSKNFINDDNKYIVYLIIFSSIIFFIAINSLILYKIYKTKSFLLITIESLAVFLYVLSLYGYLYQMNIGIPLIINTLLAWICVFITAISRLLFPIYFFEMSDKYKKTKWTLYFFILLFISELLLLLYAQHINGSIIGKFEFIIFLTFGIYPIALVFTSLYLIFKKVKYSFYYFLIQLIVALISTIHTLTLIGILKFTWTTPYIMHAIILFDSLFILILQYYVSRNKYQEQIKQNEMLLEQSRFYSIGKTIGHITHQWKHPLSRIAGTVTAFDFMIQNNKKDLVPYLETKLETLKNSIKEMSFTVENFSNIFKTSLDKNEFYIKEIIENNVISLMESKIIENNVNIKNNIDSSLKINSHEHIISNIFMILIDNSIDAFDNSIISKDINIECSVKNNICKIFYQDNAGGIKIKPIEKTFEYFISSKKNNKGSGIGLPLLKLLVEDRLNGQINIRNTDDGCIFEIKFKVKDLN